MPQLRLDVAEEIIFFFKSSFNLSKNPILMIISILQMKEMKYPEIMDSVPGHTAGKSRKEVRQFSSRAWSPAVETEFLE